MDYPDNLKTALEVEEVVRSNGATPATIAIMDGKLRVGLTKDQIENLAKNAHKSKKCSRRDIATILARNGWGSTTVAGTMIIANMAGIKVFATGGIGGVHRGVEKTMDVSADLTELGRTPVTVVSAGVKSILDIAKTLEVLETQGVNVFGWKTIDFPAFYTAKSGHKAHEKLGKSKISLFFFQLFSVCLLFIWCILGFIVGLEGAEDAGGIVYYQYDVLNLQTGMLVSVPIPPDDEANCAEIDQAISTALKEAE